MSEIDRVKSAIDAVAFISAYVPLKRTGSSRFVGRCPFHDDRSPSFHVNADGLFYCFGCGVGGDVIRFIELKEGVGFREALERAADFAGVQLSERAAPDPGEAENFEMGLAILEVARQYYHRLLRESSRAEAARAYLRSRDFDEPTWTRFELGYAWGAENDFAALARKKGWPIEICGRLGLLAGSLARDRFVHRVMFPIRDHRARAVGFGGRRLDETDPAKYINSPDSRWFHKGTLLYGMHLAQTQWRDTRRAVLCEGYLDVIRLHTAGVTEAVAPLGTALTEKNAARVASHVHQVVLAFDADTAGRKAAFQSWATLVQRGVEVRWLRLPEGEDPDSFVRAHGGDAIQQHIAAAPLFWPTWLSEQIAGEPEASARHAAVESVVLKLAEFHDAVLAELLLAELAAAARVSTAALTEKLERLRRRAAEPKPALQSVGQGDRPAALESKLATWLVHHPDQRFTVVGALGDADVHPWLKLLLAGGSSEHPGYREWVAAVHMAEPLRGNIHALVSDVRALATARKLKILEARADELQRAGRLDEYRALLADIQSERRPRAESS